MPSDPPVITSTDIPVSGLSMAGTAATAVPSTAGASPGLARPAGDSGSPSTGGTGARPTWRSASGEGHRTSRRAASRGGDRSASASSMPSPSVTAMIRADHAHVLTSFHRFRPGLSRLRQQAIADAICLALEVHAQLEEEIFFPALQEVAGDDPVLKDARPGHEEMRRLIAELRGCEPGEPRFRETLNQLMRDVMHHVADEETVLLPLAEARLAGRLGELGRRMTGRRIALMAPHTLQVAKNRALAAPVSTLAALGAVAGGAWLLASSMGSSRR